MERCFRLATSIDLQLAAVAAEPQEKAIGGVTSGLIGEGEWVQWRGRHLGRWRTHTSKVDGWRPFTYFREVMSEGPLTRFEHEHHFAVMDDGTRMRDEIHFAASGMMARMVEKVARRHLIGLLKRRNALIKSAAESEEWRRYLEKATTVKAGREATLTSGWDKSSALQRG